MTSCAMLGMRTSMGRYCEDNNNAADEEDCVRPLKKLQKMMKKIDGQVQSLQRIILLLLAVEIIRMVKT